MVALPKGGAGKTSACPPRPPVDAPVEQHILALSCGTPEPEPAGFEQRHYVRWHFGFDDRHFDPVRASLIVVNCVTAGRCDYPYVAGQMLYYAEAKPEDVATGLARLQLSDDARRAWVTRYGAARTELLASATAIKADERVLVVDVPAAVRAERAKYYAALGDDLDAYDALAPALDAALKAHTADRALLDRAVALRDRHVRRCVRETPFSTRFCWHGTIARPLTLQIAWLAVFAGDGLLAHLEHDTLGTGLDVTGAALHISMVQRTAMSSGASLSWEPWSRLDGLKEGRHDALAVAVKALEGSLGWSGEALRSVTPRGGGLATIAYDDRTSGMTDYACSKNLQLRQEDDGRIRAYQRCRVRSQTSETHVTKPVVVPASDTSALAKGNFVFTVFDTKTRRGRVIHARPTLYSEQHDLSAIRFTAVKAKVDVKDEHAIAAVGSY